MLALTLLTLLLSLFAGPARAHGLSEVDTGSLWSSDRWLLTPLYVVGIGFYIGTQRLWHHAGGGRGVSFRQVGAFWTGWLIVALALTSPIHWLGERLFTAHMIEHELLMVVGAPLMAFARINGPMLWGLPATLRPTAGRWLNLPIVARPWAVISHPLSATGLHGLALWVWHAPPLYTWALQNTTVHRFQHISFFTTALLFWWVLLHGRGVGRSIRLRDGIAIVCLFVTVLHSGVLGALLTLSTRVWIPGQGALAGEFGLSQLEDQQLAGILMWVPMGLLYTGAALFFAYRWLTAFDAPARRTALGPAG
ncbi:MULTISPECIES: cytochrome c oxidase assembly protein [unclassified Bradyrhizobium]|uniref:cytochrome c oxidase assembly protein n=1 Tax=unclassified Bradyrhizobium TaxID=2631580 RepID=UPI0020B36B6C|nr:MULTISPECIES: cytochrome c oxidase assembly protein [unclassified Bradyrhizobium]MCP3402086.1 cytochrome c oxidase assembly protein [Bradyrhizobium sp. CCGB20]MCP3410574.1 cytochrome c oxidase assembly protein [Bradyrhizobium sp. CCGB01]